MWVDRRKKHRKTIKLDDYEHTITKIMAQSLKVDESEAIRRCIWGMRILFDPDLKIKDLFMNGVENAELFTFGEACKPLPELAGLIGLDLKLWREFQLMTEKLKENEKNGVYD